MTRRELNDCFVDRLSTNILESKELCEVVVRCFLWEMVEQYGDQELMYILMKEGVNIPKSKWLVKLSTESNGVEDKISLCCVAGLETEVEMIAREIYPCYDVEHVIEVES